MPTNLPSDEGESPSLNDVTTVTKAAQQLGVDASTVRRWCESGLLSARKLGKTWIIAQDAIDHFERPKLGSPFKKERAE